LFTAVAVDLDINPASSTMYPAVGAGVARISISPAFASLVTAPRLSVVASVVAIAKFLTFAAIVSSSPRVARAAAALRRVVVVFRVTVAVAVVVVVARAPIIVRRASSSADAAPYRRGVEDTPFDAFAHGVRDVYKATRIAFERDSTEINARR
jgi:hypothetical protein